MAKKVTFKMNIAGFDEVRNSGPVQARCHEAARAVASRANSMTRGLFYSDVRPGRKRCHAMVKPSDGERGNIAVKDNLRKNILLKALG